MKITKSQLKQVIKEEVQIVLDEAEPSSDDEVIEESLGAIAKGAALAFLTVAASVNMSAPDIADSAGAATAQMQKAGGDAAAKAYAIELLKNVADAERDNKLAAGAVDLTAKKLKTVVGSNPDVLDALRAPSKPEKTGPGKVTGGGPAMSAVQFKEELETLNEYDSKKIDKIAQVLQTHYSDSIPVVAKYLKTIDMLNNQFSREETPAANALYDALYNMGDIEQPIMFAVRQLMKNKE